MNLLAKKVNIVYNINMVYETTAESPRERRRKANKKRILDQTMDLILEHGFQGVSIHKIAAALDYTPGALYRYFPSKDALIAALATQVIEDFAVEVNTMAQAYEEQGPLHQIMASLYAYKEMANKKPHQFGLLSMLMAEPRMLVPHEEDAAPTVVAIADALKPLLAAYKKAAEGGALKKGDAQERAVVAFAALHGVLQLRKQEPRAPAFFPIDRLCAVTIRGLLIADGAQEDAVDQVLAFFAAPAQEIN